MMEYRRSEHAARKTCRDPAQNISSQTYVESEHPAAVKLSRQQEEETVAAHMGLARAVAMRLSRIYGGLTDAEEEDLIQIGYIGLLKAVRGFEPERGLAFSTYAVPVITGEIKSQIRDHGRVKMSRQLKRNAALVRRAQTNFMMQNGTSPRLTELAQMTGMSTEHVAEAIAAADAQKPMHSLSEVSAERTGGAFRCRYGSSEASYAGSGKDTGSGYIRYASALASDDEEQRIEHLDLASAVSGLEVRQRQVILLRYYKDFTQQQIAARLGVSQVQVSRIEKKALKAMAYELEKTML